MGQATQTTSDNQKAQQNFSEILRKFDNAMLVTHSSNGATLHARPMAVAETSPDGSVWFITGSNTPKVDEIKADSQVVATFQEGKRYLSVSGRAVISRDRAHIERVWKESFGAWFEGKDDPNIVLLGINPDQAEYWDNAGLQGIKLAVKAAGAYLTGKELKGAEDVNIHGKVQL
jgi:general stress protein 26